MHIHGWKLERVQLSGYAGQQRTEKTGDRLPDELDSGPRGGLWSRNMSPAVARWSPTGTTSASRVGEALPNPDRLLPIGFKLTRYP
jgi:hypothetical protein